MNKRVFVFWISIIFLSSAFWLLISGSELLAKPLFEAIGFPFGTLVTWLGIIALPTAIYSGFNNLYHPKSRIDKKARVIALCILIMAFLWGFIAYGLAENWSFTFGQKNTFRGSSEAAEFFWNYSYLVVGLSVVFLILHAILVTTGRLNNRK